MKEDDHAEERARDATQALDAQDSCLEGAGQQTRPQARQGPRPQAIRTEELKAPTPSRSDLRLPSVSVDSDVDRALAAAAPVHLTATQLSEYRVHDRRAHTPDIAAVGSVSCCAGCSVAASRRLRIRRSWR